MKKKLQKLRLKRDRLRRLNPDALNFAGGATPTCPTQTCEPTTGGATAQTACGGCDASLQNRCAGSAQWSLCDTSNCDYY